MRKIRVSDITLRECANSADHSLSFKEKIEMAKLMDKLHYDSIEMPEIKNISTDVLLIKTIASLVKNTQVVVPVGTTAEDVELAWNSVKAAEKAALKVSVPVSAVQMEYKCGKKPPVVKDTAAAVIAECKKYTSDVEFAAEDAMRAEKDFLYSIITAAIEAGASSVCVCDSEGTMMPCELAGFVNDLYANVPALKDVVLSVEVSDNMNMAVASAFAAVNAGAGEIKTVADSFAFPTIESVMKVFKLRGDSNGVQSKIRTTELSRVIAQMQRMISTTKSENSPFENGVNEADESLTLDKNDDISTVIKAICKIGYDLSEEDNAKVYDAFKRVAAKKDYVGTKELEAIIASTALQVPSTYTIDSYVINCGNVITATANIKLVKDGETISGVSVGDGPIDAAFLAVEQIIGHHYELDDFQIKSVTEGREAMGSALVKLRSASGKLYSGTGISTDVIGASIRAYVSALNKIAYEEE
ncbi:MAG: hypothetical protein IKV49_03910 [Clostridia bacterium]|nr:hypothetical protein [Clostridia bacterium]